MKTLLTLLIQASPVSGEELASKADSAKVTLQQFTEKLTSDPGTALQSLGRTAIQFGLKVLAALAIYIVGAWIIKRIKNGLKKMFERRKTDRAMASFISSFVSIALTVVLIIVVIGALGINTTSLAALLAAGGVAIGMALSGTMQNFAGGLMIMAFKPFKAGDFIEAQGYEVTIVGTHLTTTDNRNVILPNGALSNGNIVNYNHYKMRRIDIPVSVEYGTDAAACKEKLLEIARADARVLDSTTRGAADPLAAVQKLADSSVDFLVRVWVKTADYWPVQFDLTERIYTELPKAGIQFPFPQMDVHVHQAGN